MPYEVPPPVELTPEQEAESELLGRVDACLRVASHDVMVRHHHADIICHDQAGHFIEHTVTPQEAEDIDRAVWSAGEDMTIEALRNNLVAEMKTGHFDLASTAVEVVGHGPEQRKAA